MDTYAASASDPDGFYNLPGLAPAVAAFFVMDYELNLAGTASSASPPVVEAITPTNCVARDSQLP